MIGNEIQNHLLLNGLLLDDVGLMYGKMGMSAYFFTLGHDLNDQTSYEFGAFLLEDVYDNLYEDLDLSHDYGLTGIGNAVIYLASNSYISYTKDIFFDIDTAVHKYIHTSPEPFRSYKNLIGVGFYLVNRAKLQRKFSSRENTFWLIENSIMIVDEMEKCLAYLGNSMGQTNNSEQKKDLLSSMSEILTVFCLMLDLNFYKKVIVKNIKETLGTLELLLSDNLLAPIWAEDFNLMAKLYFSINKAQLALGQTRESNHSRNEIIRILNSFYIHPIGEQTINFSTLYLLGLYGPGTAQHKKHEMKYLKERFISDRKNFSLHNGMALLGLISRSGDRSMVQVLSQLLII